MEVLLGAAGAVLVAAATVDSLWTTLWTDGGAGPLAGRVSGLLWALLRGPPGRDPHAARRFAGPVKPPPPADLDVLRRAGLPTVDDDAFAADLAPLAERRRCLHALVEDDAWDWPGRR